MDQRHQPLFIDIEEYNPKEKGNMIADCLENRFTFYDLYDDNHGRRVENGVQALLASVDDTTLGYLDLETYIN
jgi:hypothetical protein